VVQCFWRHGVLIVTGVEVVIENCLTEVRKILLDFRNWGGKVSNSDHSTRDGLLPTGGPLWPCVYLAPLPRYSHL